MKVPNAIRSGLVRVRRAVFESVGDGRYSWTALHDIDRKIARHLDFDSGVFIEAGANDGITQSNTYYLEKIRHWTGLLVEPAPLLAAASRKNRRAKVVQAALVAHAKVGETVELHFAGLMSTLTGALGAAEATARHIQKGLEVQGLSSVPPLVVPARTLSAIIEDVQLQLPIDLLSLDVEGGEPAALAGLDLARHAPRFICVEVRDATAISAILEPRYRLVEILHDAGTYQDLLYVLR